MTTIVETQPAAGEERLLLRGIRWDFYLAFCEELNGQRAVRLSYDRGNLEIMIVRPPHEFHKTMLAKIVEAILFELNIPVRSGGSMTFQREDLERGFEPDESWWIANEAAVRGKKEIDFQRDPPPDLAVEVEMTTSLVGRVGIYAAMGVPEIWRFDGTTLRFCVLQENGTYRDAEQSEAFPFLRPEHVTPCLRLDEQVDETTRLRQFVQWLRGQETGR